MGRSSPIFNDIFTCRWGANPTQMSWADAQARADDRCGSTAVRTRLTIYSVLNQCTKLGQTNVTLLGAIWPTR